MKTRLLPLTALLAAACAAPAPEPTPVCTMEARSAFALTVLDSVTGRNLAPAATVRVTAGQFADTLVALPPDSVYAGAHEQAGEYAIAVSRAGYVTWQRQGVRVGRDECHVITLVDTVRLRPQQ